MGTTAYLVDNPDELEKQWVGGVKTVGVTAGASAPDVLVQQVVDRLREWGCTAPSELEGTLENIVFSMPKELKITEA